MLNDVIMRSTYHALNMLCVFLLFVGDLVKFSYPIPKYKQRSSFLGESEVEHRDYIDSVFSWISCIAVVTKK